MLTLPVHSRPLATPTRRVEQCHARVLEHHWSGSDTAGQESQRTPFAPGQDIEADSAHSDAVIRIRVIRISNQRIVDEDGLLMLGVLVRRSSVVSLQWK